MSRTIKKEPSKPKFDTKPYEQPGLTENDILQIKEVFDMFDREHAGIINPKEIKNAIGSLGPEARNQAIYQLAVDLTAEGHGSITFEEFIHLMTPRLIEGDSRENIDRIFSLFDTEKTGFISVKDLRRIAHQVGGDITEQDLEDMIKRADKDLDGLVSRDEFFELLSGVSVQ